MIRKISQVVRRFINIDELVFDALIISFAGFIYGLLVPPGKSLVDSLPPAGIFLLGLLVNFFITLFMGRIYRSFLGACDAGYVTVPLKVLFFFGIAGVYLALILFFAAYRIMPWSGLPREMDSLLILAPVYPLFWGMFCGFGPDELGEVKYTLYIPGCLAAVMIPYASVMFGYYIRWYWGIISFPLLILALYLPYFLRALYDRRNEARRLAGIKKRMQTATIEEDLPTPAEDIVSRHGVSPLRSVLESLGDQLLLPALMALALLLWQVMTVEMLSRAYGNWGLSPDTDFIFLSLFISGIVPLRILSQLAPPYKAVNTLITGAALFFYITSLYRGLW